MIRLYGTRRDKFSVPDLREQCASWGGVPFDDAPWVLLAREAAIDKRRPFNEALDYEIHRAFNALITMPLAHVIGLGHRPAPLLRKYIGETLTEDAETPVLLRVHRRESGRPRSSIPSSQGDDPRELYRRLLADDFEPLAQRLKAGDWIGSAIAQAFASSLAPAKNHNGPVLVAVDRKSKRPDTRPRKKQIEKFYKKDKERLIRKEIEILTTMHRWDPGDAIKFTALTCFDSTLRQAVIDHVNQGLLPSEALRRVEKLKLSGSSRPPVESVRKIWYETA
jgi:hypothetical protein